MSTWEVKEVIELSWVVEAETQKEAKSIALDKGESTANMRLLRLSARKITKADNSASAL